MSHFSVLVFGKDVDSLLSPYHEFECTGHNDEYIQDIDNTEEARADYEQYKDDPDYPTFADFVEKYYGTTRVEPGESINIEEDHKFGYFMVDEQGEVLKVIRRTNPNAQWEWYEEGGRWKNMLLLKNGQKADSALKKDIDLDKMRADAEAEGLVAYTNALARLGDLNFRSWDDVYNDESIGAIEDRRKFYHDQEQVMRFYADQDKASRMFGANPDAFKVDQDTYVRRARNNALSAYAVIDEANGWISKGKMGWFGMSSDNQSEDAWAQALYDAINALPDDELITVIDCHI